jgi:hypothetical protein
MRAYFMTIDGNSFNPYQELSQGDGFSKQNKAGSGIMRQRRTLDFP